MIQLWLGRRFNAGYDNNPTKQSVNNTSSCWVGGGDGTTQLDNWTRGGRFFFSFLKRALVPADIWTGRWLMCCFTLFSVDRVGRGVDGAREGPPLWQADPGCLGQGDRWSRGDPPYLTMGTSKWRILSRVSPGGLSHWAKSISMSLKTSFSQTVN